MKHMFVVSVALALVCLSCSPPQEKETVAEPVSKEADVQAVRSFITLIEQTLDGGSLEKYMETVAEDAIFLPTGASHLVGKQAVRAYFEEAGLFNKDIDFSFEFDEIVIADDLAICAGRDVEIDRSDEGGKAQPRTFNDLHIYKKQEDGLWKQWRIMWNPTDLVQICERISAQ